MIGIEAAIGTEALNVVRPPQPWIISDALWAEIEPCIPNRERDPNRVYHCKPGRGRKPLEKRRVMEGIFYVLRNGCLWKALPKEYGAASSVHRYFQEWCAAGVFKVIWRLDLTRFDELEGIGWVWQQPGGVARIPLPWPLRQKQPSERRGRIERVRQ